MKIALLPFAILSAMAFSTVASAQVIVDLNTYHEIDNTNASGTNWRGYEVVGGASSGTIGNSSSTFSNGRLSLGTFLLPSLSGPISDADVSFFYNNGASGSFNGATIDLYVHNSFSTNQVLDGNEAVGDYNIPYANTSGSPTAANYTLIQKDFVVPTVSTGEVVSLSASGQSALTSFLQSNYTAGEYIVFAAALDINTNTPSGDYGVGMIYDGIAANASQQLSITVIPEPTTAALLAAGLGILMIGRRRRVTRA